MSTCSTTSRCLHQAPWPEVGSRRDSRAVSGRPGAHSARPGIFGPYGQCGKMLERDRRPARHVRRRHGLRPRWSAKPACTARARTCRRPASIAPGFPGAGAGSAMALGSAERKPADVRRAARPSRLCLQRPEELGPGFLPAEHQGTILGPERRTRSPTSSAGRPRQRRSVRDRLDRLLEPSSIATTQATRARRSRLEARIRSYELAARMQLAAPRRSTSRASRRTSSSCTASTIARRLVPPEINAQEETEHFGRKCLVARRLLERGVRFVQIWRGSDNGFPRRNWDSHEDIARDHGPLALGMARGRRGLDPRPQAARPARRHDHPLDDRVRPDAVHARAAKGRDHNPFVLHQLARRRRHQGRHHLRPERRVGLQTGRSQPPDQVYDIHATMLHLLGIDHTRLTVRHNGIDRRLTDVEGTVLRDVLA